VHPRGRRRQALSGGQPPEEAPRPPEAKIYEPITQWFAQGNTLLLGDDSASEEHLAALRSVTGLEECVRSHASPQTAGGLALLMELVLDGLHQCSMLAKEDGDNGSGYRDMLGAMFRQMEEIE
jgi:magnesium chelatase subunit I